MTERDRETRLQDVSPPLNLQDGFPDLSDADAPETEKPSHWPDEMTEFWMTLSVDPVKREVLVLGFSPSRRDIDEHKKRADAASDTACHHESFDMMADGWVGRIRAWLVYCRVPTREIPNILKGLGDDMLRMVEGKRP